jgi:hypothetical protein
MLVHKRTRILCMLVHKRTAGNTRSTTTTAAIAQYAKTIISISSTTNAYWVLVLVMEAMAKEAKLMAKLKAEKKAEKKAELKAKLKAEKKAEQKQKQTPENEGEKGTEARSICRQPLHHCTGHHCLRQAPRRRIYRRILTVSHATRMVNRTLSSKDSSSKSGGRSRAARTVRQCR